MAQQHGGQKFVGRNRPPRVQIECDEECYGSRVKVNLPFVAGVMANLTGQWTEDPEELTARLEKAKADGNQLEVKRLTDVIRSRGELSKREFLEVDQDNFDSTMEVAEPTATLTVPNAITGEGNLGITLKFRSMRDFEPDRIAQNVEALRPLLEARQALNYLKNMANSKSGIEKLLQKLVTKPELAKALVAASRQTT